MLGLKAGVGKFDRTCVREGLFGFAKSELRLCHFLICEPESGLQLAQVGARVSLEAFSFCDRQFQGFHVAPARRTGLSRRRSKVSLGRGTVICAL